MKKSTVLFITIVIVFKCFEAKSQEIEESTFQKICTQIEKQNYDWEFKGRLKGATIVSDPVKGEKSLVYESPTNDILKFQKLSHKEQQEVLNATRRLLFPITDTIYIVDKNSFFSSGLHFEKNGHH